MRRIVVVLAGLAAFSLGTQAALAENPHFVNASASVDNIGNLVVSWKEAGLGDNQLISYLVTADATATYACINNGGKHPKAANKETVSGPVSGTGEFSSGKNGQITASLTVSPPGPGGFSCPPGQTFVLAFVSYTNISLTDTTNGVPASIPGTVEKCFVDSKLGLCP